MYDYALLKLKRPFTFNQYLSIRIPCLECDFKNPNTTISIFGFPGKIPDTSLMVPQPPNFTNIGSNMVLFQLGMSKSDAIRNVDPQKNTVYYNISTGSGQSGSPLLIDDDIIGVHTHAYDNTSNQGKYIDEETLEQICIWKR